MGPLAQFILALTNLVRSGAIKKVPDAIKFAEQQFGKVTPLLRKQIENVFSKIKKPEIGKPGKKEGTLLPFIKDKAPGEEGGLGSLDKSNIPEYDPDTRAQFEKDVEEAGGMEKFMDENPIEDMKPLSEAEKDIAEIQKSIDNLNQADAEEFRLSDDDPMGDLEQILNPRRPGGSLDPATGITRALARRILERKGIEIGKKDPIEVFSDTFGESINDVNNLAEEMLEIDARGGGMKDMDQMLEADGLFDIEIPKNPSRGLTDEEMLQLDKQVKEEKNLEQLEGLGAPKLAERFKLKKKYPGIDDELLTNIIEDTDAQHKAEVLGRLDEAFEMMSQGKGPDEIIDIFESLKNTRKDNATGGRVGLKNGSPEGIITIDDKIDEMISFYKDYLKQGGKMNFQQFSKLYIPENFATGGRVRAASGGLADILKL